MKTLRSGCIAFAMLAGLVGTAGSAAAQNGPGLAPPDYYASLWQGWYAGLHAGYGDAGSADGVVGGAQVGHNWQSGRIVYGLEADVTWSDISDSQRFDACGGADLGCATFRASGSIDWIVTGRGRLGYLFQPGLLAYATIGFAHVEASASASISGFGVSERIGIHGSDTDFVYGIGIETKFSPTTTLRVEYLGFDDSDIDIIRAGVNFKLGY